ncbi:MAG: ATP synthase subunit b [Desulfovibrio sp.]
MFDINITLVIQLINFIVVIVGLNYLLIQPIRDIVKKRRDLASGMLGDAESFTNDAADKLQNYEAALAKAREEASAARDVKRSEGTAKEAELLEIAQREAQEYLRSSREETRETVAKTMAEMEKRVPELAKLAASRLLGKTKRSSAA